MNHVLNPLALQNAPALIESVFPAQKVSFEAQRERKAGAGQTLTALGSYWKGRKPLILVRAIVLGSLLPPTGDAEGDLEIFEKLMAFDDEGLARRALAANAFSAKEMAARIELQDPGEYFKAKTCSSGVTGGDIRWMTFPLDCDAEGITLRWKREVTDDDKLILYRQALATVATYEAKAALGKRPEEVDQNRLYAPVWPAVNRHYAALGIDAHSFPELVEQLGILRYGHRPRVGDTFCGGGSIPFEAARLGCDVYASDLNPIACMLTWGALNIIGASPERRAEIEKAQREVAEAVDAEITQLGIEHDEYGNRAKAYLYCLETRCPETGWRVPMSPSWVISKTRNVIARLKPDHENQCFEIEVVTGASATEMKAAEKGTVQDGVLVYELDGKTYRTPIKTLRGDYRDAEGNTGNRLRHWEKHDFKPCPDDIFQERLYAIQWITKESLNQSRQETFFASVTEADLERERKVEAIVAANLTRWQEEGLIPDMAIEPGDETTRLGRERGWTYWHHLFNPRALLMGMLLNQYSKQPANKFNLNTFLDNSGRLVRWHSTPPHKAGGGRDLPANVFSNQALNTLFNFAVRSWWSAANVLRYEYCESSSNVASSHGSVGRISEAHPANPSPDAALCALSGLQTRVWTHPANHIEGESDLWITDPPYADAVMYHEITEYFIAWLRKNPPKPFNEWVWDSRRALAIKGSGEDFRRGMVAAYTAMTEHTLDNGMQCVMFTHQDTGVWSDMVGIFWAAGLQVVAAWYIATETTSELKKGGYVQGTLILMLKKRPTGERTGFKQRIMPAVRAEVQRQIETMMHLNDTVKRKHGEPVFNDSDLQMAGYAAALKVLTAYTQIGGEDVTAFALRPRTRGEVTVVDEIVQQAAEAANNLLVPEGLAADTWAKLSGIERFLLRMMDMETIGAAKLDNYQNFAKAFRVEDYTRVISRMGGFDMTTFDQILPQVAEALRAHADRLPTIGPILINRDLNGRIRLVVGEPARTHPTAKQAIDAIACELQERLGPHAYPAENAVLFESDLDSVCAGATSFPLEGFDGVKVIDRLATEGNWASIAPESTGAPRLVFFSIKGGVGRSTALAASAWALAQAGQRVLVLDLDLESPGLSSALLPEERRPTYGIADWLVEDLVDNGDAVFEDMMATSTLAHDGEINVVPAHGRDPGEYIAKLGRVWMPKMRSDGVREAWSQRLSRLIDALETRWRPDVILLDSRAGIDEVASSCVTDLGAYLVLLFAIDGEQTWSGYRILFRHWRTSGVVQDIRERLQVVGAMIPETDAAEYVAGLCESGYDLFTEELYDEVPPGEVAGERWSFDASDESASHYPWVVRWHRGFAALRSLHTRLESIDAQEVNTIFGSLIEKLAYTAANE